MPRFARRKVRFVSTWEILYMETLQTPFVGELFNFTHGIWGNN